MALRTPPSWLQNGSHPAENDRLTTQAIWTTTGFIGTGSLQITQNSPTGMTVLCAQGWGAVVGTTQTNMGTYIIYNDANTVLTIAAANPSNPRIDLVCATVSDSYYTGTSNTVAFSVITGTPAASPVAPTLPANSISLATVTVGAGVTQILTANITDTRVAAGSNIGLSSTGTYTVANLTATSALQGATITGTTSVTSADFIETGTNSIGSITDTIFIDLAGGWS
jgi:hypothetical protein